MSITVQRCFHCSEYLFPYRLLCPNCGSSEFADTELNSGTVEVVTHTADGITIATVACEKDLRIIARLHPTDVAVGTWSLSPTTALTTPARSLSFPLPIAAHQERMTSEQRSTFSR
jgi:RNA polymerase subunit RPABC4/transcription elongation factor Spt4